MGRREAYSGDEPEERHAYKRAKNSFSEPMSRSGKLSSEASLTRFVWFKTGLQEDGRKRSWQSGKRSSYKGHTVDA